jgi:serine/threonine protein kinase
VTQEGRIKGKFSYLSPEQAKSQPVTRRMDVFSAGIVLWEALTGRSLFRRNDDAATISAVLSGVIPPPSTVNRALPRGLDAIVMKALQRNPDTRYPTAADFAEALERLAIAGATTRAVGEYVQSSFEAGLAERRERIRQAPEQHRAPGQSLPPRSRAVADGLGTPSVQTHTTVHPVGWISDPNAPTDAPEPSNDEIEHRRMRNLIAAAMLLLVGSALGLLLARAPAETHKTAPNPPNTQTPAPK